MYLISLSNTLRRWSLKAALPLALIILMQTVLNSCSSAQIQNYEQYFAKPGLQESGEADLKVAFFGVSTLLFDDGETQIMVDGFFSRPSLLKVAFGKIKTDTAAVERIVKDYKMNRLRAVFVTHSHYDHVLDAGYLCASTGADLYGSSSTRNAGAGAGLSSHKIHVFTPGRQVQVGRFLVTPIVSRHSPVTVFNNDLRKKIKEPLHQPAKAKAYSEGGTYDLLIRHGGQSFLVKASANFVEGALDGYQADTVFLATARLGKQKAAFKERYYQQSVKTVKAKTVIPLHWDNFFRPLTAEPKFFPRIGDNNPRAFDFLINKTQADGIGFKILLPGNFIFL